MDRAPTALISDAAGTAEALGLTYKLKWPGTLTKVDMRKLENFDWETRCQPTLEAAVASYEQKPVHAGLDAASVNFWFSTPKWWPPPVVTIDPLTGEYVLLDSAHQLAAHYTKTREFDVSVLVV